MNIDEYTHGGHLLYQELAETVADILKAALACNASHLRIQEIQRRAKDADSLRAKLANDGPPHKDVALAVKDLAGCRIIFYSNSHLSEFLKTKIIEENFEIIWDKTKFHHPKTDDAESTDLFRSLNYVVKLKSPRVDLPEHAHLKDLMCEVQVQTSLNHAWSEMGHDTIYKRPELQGFGSRQMKSIDDRMTKIMREYLLPAGHEFDKVARDFEQLIKGKDLLESDPLGALAASTDNNTRHDILNRYLDLVLPLYDELELVHKEVREAVVLAIKVGRETAVLDIETPYGKLPGKTSEAVTQLGLSVLDALRYLDEEGTRDAWRALVDLYPGAITDQERQQILESVHRLAENNLEVWVEADRPVVQAIVVGELGLLDEAKLVSLRPLVLRALQSMLNPIAESVRRVAEGAEIRRGHIPYSEELEVIRGQAIGLLKTLLAKSTTDAEREEVIRHLSPASAMTHLGASPEGMALIVRETATVYDIYAEFSGILSLALRQHLEHDALIDFEHYIVPADGKFPCEDVSARDMLEAALVRFRETLNRDTDFVAFKVLMGYESVFPPAWTDREFMIEGTDEYRAGERRTYVEGITEATAVWWRDFLVRCATVPTNDMAMFPPLQDFLQELGAVKPVIALSYTRDLPPELDLFLPSLLIGIEKSGRRHDLQALIDGWLDAGRYIGAIARYLEHADPLDPTLRARTVRRAVALKDRDSVVRSMPALTNLGPVGDDPDGLWPLFLEAVRFLAAASDTRWVQFVWARAKKPGIFKDRPRAEVELVLEALRPLQRLDFRSEQIISAMAVDWPRLVIDLFANRSRDARDADRGYEALPSSFAFLKETLRGEADYLMETAKTLYREDPRQHYFRRQNLVFNVFPEYLPALDAALRKFMATGDQLDQLLVAELLRPYRGHPDTHELCKDIVAGTKDEDVLREVEVALSPSGVFGGAYAIADAYQRLHDWMKIWQTDPRDAVRVFAAALARRADLQVATERRRAEERAARFAAGD